MRLRLLGSRSRSTAIPEVLQLFLKGIEPVGIVAEVVGQSMMTSGRRSRPSFLTLSRSAARISRSARRCSGEMMALRLEAVWVSQSRWRGPREQLPSNGSRVRRRKPSRRVASGHEAKDCGDRPRLPAESREERLRCDLRFEIRTTCAAAVSRSFPIRRGGGERPLND